MKKYTKSLAYRYRLLIILRKIYRRFIKIQGDPRNIALGFALGIFIGMSPIIGLHTVLAIFFAALFKWNKISAAAGVWISNPFTAPILYGSTFLTGAKLFRIGEIYTPAADSHDVKSLSHLIHMAPDAFWAMITGGVILGIPVALIGYYFAYTAVKRYQENIRMKLARQKEKLAQRKEKIKEKIKKKG
jgi:uncharacterized protein (DUF2062 family)